MSESNIRLIPPFDFDLSLGIYGRFETQRVDLYSRGRFQRVLSLAGRDHLVTTTSHGTVLNPEVTVSISPLSEATVSKALMKKIRRMMSAELDLATFYEYAENVDPLLFGITQRLFGLKPLLAPSVFESLIIAITEQQISLAAASALRGRLVEHYGTSISIEGQEYHGFPSPEVLAEAAPQTIRTLGFTSNKAMCMVAAAQKVTNGEIDLEALKDSPLETVLEELTPIHGIGPWTVEYMMASGMGRYDVIPANDVALKAAVSRYYRDGDTATEKDVREVLERWGEFKGYAAFYFTVTYALEQYGLASETGSIQPTLFY